MKSHMVTDVDVLYEGKLCVETRRLQLAAKKHHKVNVILKRCKCSKSSTLLYKLHAGVKVFTFDADDTLFFDKEETEQMSYGAGLADCFKSNEVYKRHRKFMSVLPLVFIDTKIESTNPLPIQTKIKFKGSRKRISSLCTALEREFGIIKSWFVGPENNGRQPDLRLTVSRHNISLLDESLCAIKYYTLNDINLTVLFDADNSLLVLRIENIRRSCSYGVEEMRLITQAGQNIRQYINMKEHSDRSSLSVIQDLSDPNARINHWLMNQGSLSSVFPHPFMEDYNSIGNSEMLTVIDPPDCLPPAPCGPEITHSPPIPCPPRPCPAIPRKKLQVKPMRKPPAGHMLRSESLGDICSCDRSTSYTDLMYENFWKPHVIDDSNFTYKFYYNCGLVKAKTPMNFKIDRVNRISDDLDDVDFAVFQEHEEWHENLYSSRDTDQAFQRLMSPIYAYASPSNKLNIPSKAEEHDDHYWSSELCLTIQTLFEKKKPALHQVFDITWKQYLGIVVNLDLQMQRGHDWMEFASWIGLQSFRDIEIIKHFCYTYKIMAMDVVLTHWWLQEKKGCNVPRCSFDQLRNIIIQIERKDILRILSYSNMNEDEDDFSDEDNTHF